jgi:hypothetical protein
MGKHKTLSVLILIGFPTRRMGSYRNRLLVSRESRPSFDKLHVRMMKSSRTCSHLSLPPTPSPQARTHAHMHAQKKACTHRESQNNTSISTFDVDHVPPSQGMQGHAVHAPPGSGQAYALPPLLTPCTSTRRIRNHVPYTDGWRLSVWACAAKDDVGMLLLRLLLRCRGRCVA